MGVTNVATRASDLRNLLWARRHWARRRVEIAFLDEDRNMREGGNLSRGKIPETACLKLDDALDTIRTWLERGSGRERALFGVTHQDSTA